MLIEVIPLAYSLGTWPLTYFVGDLFNPENLQVGEGVHIAIGKHEALGFVSRLNVTLARSDIEVREILARETYTPVLAPYQIGMIIYLSERYMIPIHRVAQWFFPRPVAVRLQKRWYPHGKTDLQKLKQSENALHISQKSIINHSIIARFLKDIPQVIIVPDDFTLLDLESHFASEDTLFVFQEMTDTRRAQAWIDIRAGKYKRIFWTRRILYYNLEAYTDILYLEDAFQTEYFHFPITIEYLKVLEFLDKNTQFHIDILTSWPLIKTLSVFRHFPITNFS